MGKTSSAVKNRYNAKAYDQLPVRVPKGRKATVEELAKGKGESVNGMINRLLREEAGLTEEEWKDTLEVETDKIIEENIEAFKALAKE